MLRRRRPLTLALAAGYLLAITVAGLFHDHGRQPRGCGADGCASSSDATEAAAHAGHHHRDGAQPPEHDQQKRCPDDGSRCTVCQLLTHKPVVPHGVEVVQSAVARAGIVATAPVRPAVAVRPVWQIRAPPSCA